MSTYLALLVNLAVVVTSSYAAGRVHQALKHGLDREANYRLGYDQASVSMFESGLVHSRPL